jgi:hypothetical protein
MASPDDAAPVRLQPPPAALLRVLNPIVRASLGTPFWRLLPRWMAVLEFQGRRSGKEYRIPVGVHDANGAPAVFSLEAWRLNFEGGAPVTVVAQGHRRTGTAQLVRDPAVVGPAFLAALEHTSRPSNIGLAVAKGHKPTAEEMSALGREMIVIHYDD